MTHPQSARGRREVGESYLQTQELQGSPLRVGLHNTASSPASPTKETVERLSLFLLSHGDYRLPKSPKSPWIPNKKPGSKGFFAFLCLFLSIDPYSSLSWIRK